MNNENKISFDEFSHCIGELNENEIPEDKPIVCRISPELAQVIDSVKIEPGTVELARAMTYEEFQQSGKPDEFKSCGTKPIYIKAESISGRRTSNLPLRIQCLSSKAWRSAFLQNKFKAKGQSEAPTTPRKAYPY